MAKVGDKFIVEISEVFTSKGKYMDYGCEENEYEENLYRVKGFNSLVFDDHGLNRLEKYEPGKNMEEEIKVGDEVVEDGTTFIVTFVSNSTLENGSRIISGIRNGKCDLGFSVLTDTSRVKATGRRHEFLASSIESLKEYI